MAKPTKQACISRDAWQIFSGIAREEEKSIREVIDEAAAARQAVPKDVLKNLKRIFP